MGRSTAARDLLEGCTEVRTMLTRVMVRPARLAQRLKERWRGKPLGQLAAHLCSGVVVKAGERAQAGQGKVAAPGPVGVCQACACCRVHAAECMLPAQAQAVGGAGRPAGRQAGGLTGGERRS